MKRAGLQALLLAGGALFTTVAPAQPQTFAFDRERSVVHAEVLHFGAATLRLRWPAEGEATLDVAAGTGVVSVRVPSAAVSSGLGFFDARLREPDLLASAAHPQVFFVARTLRFDGPLLREMRGELTLRGTGQPFSLLARRFGCIDEAPGGRRCGGDFEGELLRSSFGMDFGLPFVADRVRLRVQVEGLAR